MYPVEPYDDFPINQVLDAHWGVLYDEDVSYSFIVVKETLIDRLNYK